MPTIFRVVLLKMEIFSLYNIYVLEEEKKSLKTTLGLCIVTTKKKNHMVSCYVPSFNMGKIIPFQNKIIDNIT